METERRITVLKEECGLKKTEFQQHTKNALQVWLAERFMLIRKANGELGG